jgi:hypothetical protein
VFLFLSPPKGFRNSGKIKKQHNPISKYVSTNQLWVAKMGKGDPSVSIDLLIRALFNLGMTKKYLAQILLK